MKPPQEFDDATNAQLTYLHAIAAAQQERAQIRRKEFQMTRDLLEQFGPVFEHLLDEVEEQTGNQYRHDDDEEL